MEVVEEGSSRLHDSIRIACISVSKRNKTTAVLISLCERASWVVDWCKCSDDNKVKILMEHLEEAWCCDFSRNSPKTADDLALSVDYFDNNDCLEFDRREVLDEAGFSLFLDLLEMLEASLRGESIKLFDASMILMDQIYRSAALKRYWKFIADEGLDSSIELLRSVEMQPKLEKIWNPKEIPDLVLTEERIVLLIIEKIQSTPIESIGDQIKLKSFVRGLPSPITKSDA